MSTLKLENIKHENSTTDNMVMDSDGSVSVTNKLGIGTTTPQTSLHMKGELTIDGGSTEAGPKIYRDYGSAPDIRFFTHGGTKDNPTTKASGQNAGQIHFHGHDGTDYQLRASMEVLIDGAVSAGNVPMRIQFLTGNSGTRSVALKIDNNGNVTKPRQPAFYAGGGSAGAQTNGAIITAWSEFHDATNSHSNGRFTAPVSGFYAVSMGIRSQGTGANAGTMYAQVWKNSSGAQGLSAIEVYPGMSTEHHRGGGYIYLNANDYIEIYAGSNVHIDNSDHFAVTLLS